jgi:hypothetical protein
MENEPKVVGPKPRSCDVTPGLFSFFQREGAIMSKTRLLAAAFLLCVPAVVSAQTPPPPPPPTVQYAMAGFYTSERSVSAMIVVTLMGDPAGKTVTVDYATSDGTATAGADYASKSGTLTFSPGVTSQTFYVTVYKDLLVEDEETVKLDLSNVVNADYGIDKTAVLTIWDNPPVLTVHPGSPAICSGGIATGPHQTLISATLTDGVDPWVNETIDFSTTAGSVSPASNPTDSLGIATTVLTSNGTASDGATLYKATVTATVAANTNVTATCEVEFQPTTVMLTATYSELVTGESTDLEVTVTWNTQAIASHSLGWRISQIWDEGGNLIYDGTGTQPSGYGSIIDTSTETDSNGKGKAVYESGENGGTVELEASDQSVTFCVSGENPKDTNKEDVKKPKLIVQRQTDGAGGYQEIKAANTNTDVLPGQLIDLKIILENPPKGAPTYQWGDPAGTIPGVIFKNYVANQTTGTRTPMAAGDFTNQTIQFYWADHGGAGREVKAKATIGKVEIKGSGTLNVISPTATYTRTQGTVGFNAAKDRIGLFAVPGTTDTNGITFTGNVTVPAPFAAGKFNWVQLNNDGRKRTKKDGTKEKVKVFGTYVVDTTYPYEPGPFTAHPGTAGGYATGGAQTDSDSPADFLPGDDSLTNRSNDGTYDMYLMFLPPGTNSRYVPLKKMTWTWKYAVTNAPVGGVAKWTIDGGSTGQTKGDPVDTTDHPQWTANWAPQEWVADNPVPTVTSITPASGKNNGTVDITNLAGTNFVAGATVRLKKGTDIINATAVVVVSATKITCTFDLAGKAAGQWDVEVFSPFQPTPGRLANGFTVQAP